MSFAPFNSYLAWGFLGKKRFTYADDYIKHITYVPCVASTKTNLVCFIGLLLNYLIQYFDAFLGLLWNVLCNVANCGIHSKLWTFNRFHFQMMYRQVPSLEASWFLRFLGQPTEAFRPQHSWNVGMCQPELVACRGLTWKFSHVLGCCCETCIPGWDLGSWEHIFLPMVADLLPCKMQVQSLLPTCKGREGVRSLLDIP